jgi:O-antigen/teichoic acid export membrane protein
MNAEVRSDRDRPGQATRRVARNTLFLGIADLANKLMMFFFFMLTARHLGVGQFGVLSFAFAFVAMLGVFADLGLGAVAAREIARDRSVARRQTSNAVAIKVLASVLTYALIVVSVRLIGYAHETVRVVTVCGLFVIGNAFALYLGCVFQGFERMEFTAMSRVIQTLVLVAGAVVLSRGFAGAEHYAMLYAGAGLVSALFAWSVASIGFVKPGFSIDLGEWRRMLRAGLPIGIATALVAFYYWNGSALLIRLQGDAAVGNYNAAFRLIWGLAFAGFAFSGAIYPLLSRLFVNDPERSVRALEQGIRYLAMLTLPIATFVAVFARPVILLLYGGGYLGAVVVLRVLAWWGVCASLNSLLSNYFFSANRSGTVTAQSGLALGVNLVLNFTLIPAIGAVGAAVSIVAAEAISLVFLVVQQRRTPARVRVRPVLGTALRAVTALAVAGLAASAAARWNLYAGLAAGTAVYLLVLVAVRGVDRGDWTLLRPLLKSRDG